jgi:hypothetical protein
MSTEMQKLIQALEAQTTAINKLVQSNTQIVALLIESIAGEEIDQLEPQYDLSGKRIL